MDPLADLSGRFTALLYEWRLLIGGAGLMAVAGFAWLARRRRWDRIARRHPFRTAAAAVVVLAVALPSAWYLGSPLFIRTQLLEPDPAALRPTQAPPGMAASAAPTSQATASTSIPPTPAPTPTPEVTPFMPRTVVAGTFDGVDDFHFGHGTALVIETAPGSLILRLESFSVRNGPDLYVYMSPSETGYTRGAVEVGKLKATDGSFNYELASGFDLSAARSVIIWCKQFSALFAVAPLATT